MRIRGCQSWGGCGDNEGRGTRRGQGHWNVRDGDTVGMGTWGCGVMGCQGHRGVRYGAMGVSDLGERGHEGFRAGDLGLSDLEGTGTRRGQGWGHKAVRPGGDGDVGGDSKKGRRGGRGEGGTVVSGLGGCGGVGARHEGVRAEGRGRDGVTGT